MEPLLNAGKRAIAGKGEGGGGTCKPVVSVKKFNLYHARENMQPFLSTEKHARGHNS